MTKLLLPRDMKLEKAQRRDNLVFSLYSYKEHELQTHPYYDIIAKSPTNAYRIHDASLGDFDDIVKISPEPNDCTDGAIVHLYSNTYIEDDSRKTDYYFRPLFVEHDVEYSSVGKYYRAGDFGFSDALDLGNVPRIKAVAMDETANFSDEVAEKLGKVMSVYFYNEAQVTHLCEITPSYELHFAKNYSQNFVDADIDEYDSEDIDNFYRSLGFQDEMNFKNSSGGEDISYFHCSAIDKLNTKEDVHMPEDWIDEYMFTSDDDKRKLIDDAFAELSNESNGDIMQLFPPEEKPMAMQF